MHGYYIELPRSQSERAPPDWQRRQTVKNAERYITPELKQFEDKVLGSRDRALARERELFDALLDRADRGARAAASAWPRRSRSPTCSRTSPSAR